MSFKKKKKKNLPECLEKCKSSYRCSYLTQENICHNIWWIAKLRLREFGWLPSRMGRKLMETSLGLLVLGWRVAPP